MRGHYREPKDGFAFSMHSRGKCVKLFANVCSRQMETAFRQVSIQFYCQTNVIFVWAAVIIGLRHRCSSTVKPAVSPFNTVTLMSVADCQVQTWHPLSLHYVKRVTCRIQPLPSGGGGTLIAKDIVDLHGKENTLQRQLIVPVRWQIRDVDEYFLSDFRVSRLGVAAGVLCLQLLYVI